ncbi:unnamed protein product [Camellia sinensis]
MLPDELTVEILCRLPEKPLIQFESVWKAWLIPLPLFSDYRMEYAPSDCRRTPRDRGRFVESYSKLLPFQPTGRDVLDCCNGLLLILHRSSVPSQYYVCNPATKQFRFASSASTATVTHPPELNVFSSVTGKWVNQPVPLQPEPELYGFKWLCKSVYLDGLLYMLSYTKYLLCFDLSADNLNPRAWSVLLLEKGELRNTKQQTSTLMNDISRNKGLEVGVTI